MQCRLGALFVVLLTGCGGGGSSNTVPPVAVTPTPPPAATTCSGNSLINVVGASDDGSGMPGNGPALAIDDDLTTQSRWIAPGNAATLTLDLGARHLVREVGIAWFAGDQRTASFSVLVSEDGMSFMPLLSSQQSSGETEAFERYATQPTPARFIQIENFGNSQSMDNEIIEATAFGCTLDTASAAFEAGNVTPSDFALDPGQPPGSNFDLISWKLDTPADLDGNGIGDTASETDLDGGFTDQHFFTGADGGMVFRSTVDGAKTSANTSFTRSEFREMLQIGRAHV